MDTQENATIRNTIRLKWKTGFRVFKISKPLIREARQGVMTDRRHSLKRGDRLSKKERQTTASDWEKAPNCDMCYGSKVTATFITIKQATKQLQNE